MRSLAPKTKPNDGIQKTFKAQLNRSQNTAKVRVAIPQLKIRFTDKNPTSL